MEMRENLMEQIDAVRAAAAAAPGRNSPEVPFADFTALGARVETLAGTVSGLGTSLTELREATLKPLSDTVSDMKDQLKRSHEARDMDTLFHNRITKLEGAVTDVKSEVQLAVAGLRDDVAKMSDLAPLEDAITQCASVADVQVLATQQAALAASVSGMADWLSARPDTAQLDRSGGGGGLTGGSGAGATRFKCLTCDRDIVRPPGAAPLTDVRLRGAFLPKLDSLAPSHGLGGTLQPLGPGLNAGELRRLAEEAAAGGAIAASPTNPRGGEGGGSGRRKSGGPPTSHDAAAALSYANGGDQRHGAGASGKAAGGGGVGASSGRVMLGAGGAGAGLLGVLQTSGNQSVRGGGGGHNSTIAAHGPRTPVFI